MSMISARIERLPFARFHKHLLLMGGLGYMFDAMDAAVLAFILPVLRVEWGLTSVQIGLLGSSTFIGFFFGALLAGTLGDLIGRRAVMMWALALYCVASLVSAWVDSWPPFFAARVIAGMGTGAESAIIAPYLAEFVARRFRGSFTGALAGFFSFGFVAAALLGYFIVPAHASGWRIVLVITALPVVMLLWWRRALPESPRWLESRGRTAEAEAVLDRIEADFRRRGATLAEPRPEPEAPRARPASGPLRAAAAGPADAHHADDLDHVAVDHLQLLLVLRVDPGPAGRERHEHDQELRLFAGDLLRAGAGLFQRGLVQREDRPPGHHRQLHAAGRRGRAGAGAGQDGRPDHAGRHHHVLLHERHLRRRLCLHRRGLSDGGAHHRRGLASAIGRLGAIASPVLVGYLYPKFGFLGVFGTTTVTLVLGALVVLVMGVPTRGRSLEAIAAGEAK